MPLRRPQGAIAATLWRSRPIQLIRALGWLSLLPDRLEWQPLTWTPFFPPLSIPLDQIKTAIVGGIVIGPDLRIDTNEGTLRFTVWRRELLRQWLVDTGIPIK